MPISFWTEEEVLEHTRRAVQVAVMHERSECLAILADVQVAYHSDACGFAADRIRAQDEPKAKWVNPVSGERAADHDEYTKFGF